MLRPSSGNAPMAIVWTEPPPRPPPTGSLDLHDAVTVLVDPTRDLGCVASGVVVAVDMELAPPLTVARAVEPEVEPGAEMEAGAGRHRVDAHRPLGAVGHDEHDRAAEEAPIRVVEAQVDPRVGEGLLRAVRVLDAAAQTAAGRPGQVRLHEVVEQRRTATRRRARAARAPSS